MGRVTFRHADDGTRQGLMRTAPDFAGKLAFFLLRLFSVINTSTHVRLPLLKILYIHIPFVIFRDNFEVVSRKRRAWTQ